jgi:transcriptional regulator with XRE-family HTH domain
MTIAQRLRDLRKENSMTLYDVARRIGTTRQTMSRYETGVITKIEYDTIVVLARIYNVHPGYIMGWCERDGSTGKTVSPERKKLIDFIEQLPEEQLDFFITLFSLPMERLQSIANQLR